MPEHMVCHQPDHETMEMRERGNTSERGLATKKEGSVTYGKEAEAE